MSEEEPKEIKDDDSGEDAYVAPKQVALSELVNQDAEDESLKKYKEALLGKAASGDVPAPADDDRRVVIQKMRVLFENDERPPIEYDLSSKELIEKMKKADPFILKAGCKYKLEITFKVQHEIVSGLQYSNKVYWKGPFPVDKSKMMLGSFGPQHEPHVVMYPRYGWEECPNSCHGFKAKSVFTDDDGKKHLEYEYKFSIKKEWPKE